MRIAMVSEHASPLAVLGGVDAGGQNVHVAALAQALAARGHEVEVYTRRDAPDLPPRVAMGPGVEVVHVDAGPARPVPKDDLLPWMPAFAAWLQRAWSPRGGRGLGGRRPDVVHGHFWMSGLASLEAGRALGVPVVQTFHALGSVKRRHQGDHDTSPPQRVALEASLVRDVDLVVATCRDEVAELDALATPRRRPAVVPCGVDVQHFTPDGLAEPRAAGSPRFRMVSVGRLVERKGVETAVRALAVLPDVELVVAGGPPPHELHLDPEAVRLRSVARSLGVADRLLLVGQVEQPDVPRLLRSADVSVNVPWYEPFGIAPLEAMACGLPVVGTAVGGLLDTVTEGATGALVEPRDTAALAAVIRDLLDDPARRRRWGRAGRRRAVAHYGWDRVAASTEDAYGRAQRGSARRSAPMPSTTPTRRVPSVMGASALHFDEQEAV
ncbi:Glycosyltransferase involved in cell wall bisynthesis [Quadrisphaera granulorum]|uniref:Glycosyltransferase involved in cell wall biosynthesis n=1 Tax=Quadrisphaera granulorum TaxID=317664 RepID=A0A316A9Z5_9ACTN|nr:glycosyltransferase [Quadrisphaera granulorum]PWJ53820.1 glycosyltransferase involved in cell wall biosynthesis [Quadrisphaera granulorum]SZE96577.1 Glycosyltransferase involved in cell wall bisynthesis [Quadrisphaera granulorum]